MISETHYRRLENMYHGHPLNNVFNAKLKISKGEAELVIPIREHLFHAANAVHGAVYFKALDDVAFFAANSVVEDVFVLTASFNLYLTRPVSKGEIRSVAKLVNSTKSQFIVEAVAYDSNGNEIARGSGIYIRGKTNLSEEIGYK